MWKRIRADDSTRLRLKYDTYYHIFERQEGTRVFKDGKEFIMLSSNDYLGLSHHPKIKEAGIEAIQNGEAAQPEQDSRMGEESFTVSLKKNSLHSWVRKHVMYSLPDISPVLPQSPVLLTEKT